MDNLPFLRAEELMRCSDCGGLGVKPVGPRTDEQCPTCEGRLTLAVSEIDACVADGVSLFGVPFTDPGEMRRLWKIERLKILGDRT